MEEIRVKWIEYEKEFRDLYTSKKFFSEEKLEKHLKYAENLFLKHAPIIYTPNHFSKLTGISLKYIYSVTNSDSQKFYKVFELPKKNSNDNRKIMMPLPNLKIIQHWMFENILSKIEVSPYAKAYKKNTSLKDNAKFHRRQPKVLKLDIVSFFNSFDKKLIFNFFSKLGYTVELSNLFTELVTYNKNGLPQGASTSPLLSNILFYDFDKQVGLFCTAQGIRYTRYADDMTFSGDFDEKEIISFVKSKLSYLGFKLNKNKTRILKQSDKQIVTGIVVNEKLQVKREYRKNIRLEMYYLKKNRRIHLKKHDLMGEIKYLRSLLGRIGFVLQVNPKDEIFLAYKAEVLLILDEIKYEK